MGKRPGVCFTGHRSARCDDAELARRVDEALLSLAGAGYRSFYTGGARGFDTVAALRVLNLRRSMPDVTLTLLLPCEGQTKGWSRPDKRAYAVIRSMADEAVVLCPTYRDGCMRLRNMALVSSARVCVCYYGGVRGGTSQTVGIARDAGLDIINVWSETDKPPRHWES